MNSGEQFAFLTANEAGVKPVQLLHGYSTEVTARDQRSLGLAPDLLRAGTEVFVAAVPNDKIGDVIAACARLRRNGLTPVPHIVARNFANAGALDEFVGRLVDEAGMDRCLVLGGDRDNPAGNYDSSLQLLETGIIQKRGVTALYIGCYPEGHPKIGDATLTSALAAKIALAEREALAVTLVSQFCFDAAPIIAFAKRIRRDGISVPFRVGVAGPADRGLLLKYALICGVGNSLRVLRNRSALAKNALSGETPEVIISSLEAAQTIDPSLGLSGFHFFTFGSLAKTVQWADRRKRVNTNAAQDSIGDR